MATSDAGWNWRLAFVTFSVCVGTGFTFGFSVVAINAPQSVIVNWIRSVECGRRGDQFIKSDFTRNSNSNAELFIPNNNHSPLWCHYVSSENETEILHQNPTLNTIWALTGAALAAGAFVSVWPMNFLLATLGSKNTLLANNLAGILGTVLTGICIPAKSYELLIIGRFILGINIGIDAAITPLYLTELCPQSVRGALNLLPGLFLVIGMLIATVLGLPQVLGTWENWIIIFWLRLIPAAILFATLPFCPESPRYLILIKNQPVRAEKALRWLRGTADVNDELVAIHEAGKVKVKTVSVLGLFKETFNRKVLAVCLVVMLSQQFSGIGAILTYSTGIFSSAGLNRDAAPYGTLGVMVVAIFATVVAVLLVDRIGRRMLLLIFCVGTTISSAGMVLFMSLMKQDCSLCQYGSLVCLLLFTIVFNFGASIPWLLVPEMFTQSTQGAAITLVSGLYWVSFVVVAFLFPIVQAVIDQWIFAIFAGLMVLFTVFIYFGLIETKGKSQEQIQIDLHSRFD